MPTRIPRALLDAYRGTTYKIRVRGRDVKLRIGRRCPALARGGAFITAWNPYSERGTRAQNDAANASLERELADAGFEVLHAVALGQDRSWEEPGVFAVGIATRAAAKIGRRYRQNAIVHLAPGRAARLLVLR